MTADSLARFRNIGGPRWIYGGATALVVLHALLAVAGTWNKSATFDENAYLGNGISFWAYHDYRMSPDAVLPERWVTLPIYLAGATPTPTDAWVWREGDVWRHASDFMYHRGNDAQSMLRMARFMTTLLSAALAWITFLWAKRLIGTAGGFVALALYVFNPTVLAHGSNATSDVAAALAFTGSLWALWTLLHRLTPVTLAVSCLAVAASFVTKLSALLLVPIGLVLAVVRLFGHRPLEWRFGRRSGTIAPWWARGAVYLVLVVAHVIVTWAVIWTMFGFRFDTFAHIDGDPGKSYFGSWDEVLDKASKPLPGQTQERNLTAIKLVDFAGKYRLLPEAYLLNFLNSLTTTSVRSAFLNGRYGIYGFPSFFPYCFLYKTPPAVFVTIWLAILAYLLNTAHRARVENASWFKLLRSQFYLTAPLSILMVVYWTTSVTRGINIGLRHLLPTFPAMFILTGWAGVWLYGRVSRLRTEREEPTTSPEPAALETGTGSNTSEASEPSAVPAPAAPIEFLASRSSQLLKIMQACVVASLLWLVVDTALARGNYLAYFNFFAGGPENAYRYLVDSSLDWGQELWGLARWLEEHRSELPPDVYISHFGSTAPSFYGLNGFASPDGAPHGIRIHWLPAFLPHETVEQDRTTPRELNLSEGIYCISATSLQCVYNGNFSGPWRDDYEHNYRLLSNLMVNYLRNQDKPAELNALLAATGLPNWNAAVQMFDYARFGRLCEYLRRREPDDSVNYAILIYRLSAAELREALTNPPFEHYPPPKSPNDNVPY